MSVEVSLRGMGTSNGIGIGRVLVIKEEPLDLSQKPIGRPENEIFKFESAVGNARAELTRVRDSVKLRMGEDKAAIFDAHLSIVEDPELVSRTIDLIRGERLNVEFAFEKVIAQFVHMFSSLDNEYMRERVADIQDVARRVQRILAGRPAKDLSELTGEVVIAADELSPSQMAMLYRPCVLGILTNLGGKTSHTAIMARTLEIPAVMGLKTVTTQVGDGDWVALNGSTGEVSIKPSEDTTRQFRKLKIEQDAIRAELKTWIGKPSATSDGQSLRIEANIGTALDSTIATKYDAEGVGLFRTEFMYMDRTGGVAGLPTEDEQFTAYKQVLEAMGDKPTLIRTLDIGGDKPVAALHIPKESNPFLGFRAIRYCLRNPAVFKTQLRAMLRASEHGNLGIMFPMISSLEELREAKRLLAETNSELLAEGHTLNKAPKVGMMVEVPSVAILADTFAKEVDFFSIGTNDLIQYLCAVDRGNESVAELHDSAHPAALKLIAQVVAAGEKAGISVGMCGEMAANPELLPVLLGMGFKELSVNPAMILSVRKQLSSMSYETCRMLARHVLECGSATEVRALLKLHQEEAERTKPVPTPQLDPMPQSDQITQSDQTTQSEMTYRV